MKRPISTPTVVQIATGSQKKMTATNATAPGVQSWSPSKAPLSSPITVYAVAPATTTRSSHQRRTSAPIISGSATTTSRYSAVFVSIRPGNARHVGLYTPKASREYGPARDLTCGATRRTYPGKPSTCPTWRADAQSRSTSYRRISLSRPTQRSPYRLALSAAEFTRSSA